MSSPRSLIDFVTFGRELQGAGWYDAERLKSRLGDSDQYRWMGASETASFSFAGGTEKRVRIECSIVNIVHPAVLPPLRVLIDDSERPYTLQIGAHPPFILTVTGERSARTVMSRLTIQAPIRRSAHDIGVGADRRSLSLAMLEARVYAASAEEEAK